MQMFELPVDVDPEPGQPDSIRHGCDFMRGGDGALEFYYNFLDYTWLLPGGALAARCYLDESARLNFSVSHLLLTTLDQGGAVLSFAQRRFGEIATLETDGYKVQWIRRSAG